MTTATYLGSFDFTDEDVPDHMRHVIPMFKLLCPLGEHAIGTVLAFEDFILLTPNSFTLDALKPGDTV